MKLDGANCDLWHLNVQFLLNDKVMKELLTASTSTPVKKVERSKDVIASEHYQERLRVNQACFKREQLAYYTMLSCMRDNLQGEFEYYPTTKDM